MVVPEIAFGEVPKHGMFTWRSRLIYGYVFIAALDFILLLILLVGAIPFAAVTGFLDSPSASIGIVTGCVMAMMEYVDVRRRAKRVAVSDGGNTVIAIRTRFNWAVSLGLIYFGIMAASFVLGFASHLLGVVYVLSFVIGILASTGVTFPSVGYLLEAKFGRVYVLRR